LFCLASENSQKVGRAAHDGRHPGGKIKIMLIFTSITIGLISQISSF